MIRKKIIVIGLGNFGGNLALLLTEDGHEVYGVDINPAKVDQMEDKIHKAVGFNTTEESYIKQLPIDDCDLVIVAIGEDVGASVTTTALIRKHYSGRLIARSLSPVHKTILEAMKIEEIVEPEAEYAQELTNRIMVQGAVKSMQLHGEYEIVEVKIPTGIIGKTLGDLDIKTKYHAHIITVIKQEQRSNYLGTEHIIKRVYGILHSVYTFEADDLILIFGIKEDIDKFIADNS